LAVLPSTQPATITYLFVSRSLLDVTWSRFMVHRWARKCVCIFAHIQMYHIPTILRDLEYSLPFGLKGDALLIYMRDGADDI